MREIRQIQRLSRKLWPTLQQQILQICSLFRKNSSTEMRQLASGCCPRSANKKTPNAIWKSNNRTPGAKQTKRNRSEKNWRAAETILSGRKVAIELSFPFYSVPNRKPGYRCSPFRIYVQTYLHKNVKSWDIRSFFRETVVPMRFCEWNGGLAEIQDFSWRDMQCMVDWVRSIFRE